MNFALGVSALLICSLIAHIISERAFKNLDDQLKIKMMDGFARMRIWNVVPLIVIVLIFAFASTLRGLQWILVMAIACFSLLFYFVIMHIMIKRKFVALGISKLCIRQLMLSRWIAYIGVAAMIIIFLTLPTGSKPVDREVIYEITSPDNKYLVSFYIESGGGAAGWQQEYVSVEEVGNKTKSVVLELNRGYDVTLKWKNSSHLEIGYPDTARIDHYQNWFGRMADGEVEIIALPSVDGSLKYKE